MHDAGERCTAQLLPWLRARNCQTIALFAAQSFEVPTRLLTEALLADGRTCVFPTVIKGERALRWARIQTWNDLQPRTMGLLEPTSALPLVSVKDIDCFVVPGVAFGRDGSRLGRGAGYYDSSLAQRASAAVTIGLTFSQCVIEHLPVESHDVPVDWVCTELEIFTCVK